MIFCTSLTAPEMHYHCPFLFQTYLCLAKGGLTPDHALITPIGHHQSLTSAPGDIMDEVDKYPFPLTCILFIQKKDWSVQRKRATMLSPIPFLSWVRLRTSLISRRATVFLICYNASPPSGGRVVSHSTIRYLDHVMCPQFCQIHNNMLKMDKCTKSLRCNLM